MSLAVEALFTSALGLQPPWTVQNVELDKQAQRIDFTLVHSARQATCPHCQADSQPFHDMQQRSWRHLDFFQFEAWLHASVPRVRCSHCGKVTQIEVPWAREGSGFTAMFEALALTLCQQMPVRQASALLRCNDKALWRRIEHYVGEARAKESFAGVHTIGVDETSLHKGQSYITVVHDLPAKRLLFACEGRSAQTLAEFVADLKAHGGDPADVAHVCQDMSAAYAKGVGEYLPQAQISYDRFHVLAMAGDAMDEVYRSELRSLGIKAVAAQLGLAKPQDARALRWSRRRSPSDWDAKQTQLMHVFQRSGLSSARAWRIKMALRAAYQQAASSNADEVARSALLDWIRWARRCRLEPFKKLAATLRDKFDAVLRGMLDGRSNAYVEALNGQLQQAKRAARGYRTARNFIAIAYLRMSRLSALPECPLKAAKPQLQSLIHRCA